MSAFADIYGKDMKSGDQAPFSLEKGPCLNDEGMVFFSFTPAFDAGCCSDLPGYFSLNRPEILL